MVDEKTIAGLPILPVKARKDKMKALIYGEPGAGKTTLAASVAEVNFMNPILIIDIEKGTRSIQDVYPDIDTVEVSDKYNQQGKLVRSGWETFEKIYEELKKGTQYKTIIVDNLSDAYRLGIELTMQGVVAKDENRDVDLPAPKDYKKTSAMMRRLVRFFRDLDAYVIFTAHYEERYSQAIPPTLMAKGPALSGQLMRQISGFVWEVLYLEARTKKGEKDVIERVLLSQPVNKYIAKDRSRKLPPMMSDPTMKKITDLVIGSDGMQDVYIEDGEKK